MFINLSLKNVDSYVDLVLNKRSDLKFSRRKFASPEKIVYSIQLLKFDNFKFMIHLYNIEEEITDIVFPVHVPNSEVFPSPFPGGGRIEVTHGLPYEPSFNSEAEEAMYQVCQAIWSENKLKGYFLHGAHSSKREKFKHGPQLETEESLKKLREIRLSAIQNHTEIPPRRAAMELAGISRKTWKKHDPRLYAHWDDKEEKWE